MDVAHYNESTIKFYEKNNFVYSTTLINYFDIKGEYYDSKVFVRMLAKKEKDLYKEKRTNIITTILNMVLVEPLSFIIKIILFFILFHFY